MVGGLWSTSDYLSVQVCLPRKEFPGLHSLQLDIHTLSTSLSIG
jgi:hypothetical protein